MHFMALFWHLVSAMKSIMLRNAGTHMALHQNLNGKVLFL